MLDFCYLVNPYFPPKRLISEIKANFEKLLMNYPSGEETNAPLAAKNFSVRQEQIIVGNGAAELIKSIMNKQEGKVGFVRPTFEEYPNCYNEANSVVFIPNKDDFTYDENDLMKFFEDFAVKSISKSYGVPGLRLGIAVSGDVARIAELKKFQSGI